MSWFDHKDKPETPQIETEGTPWMRVWLTLRGISLKELWPIVISVPAIVFFAVSGVIAWLYICLRSLVLFVRSLFK